MKTLYFFQIFLTVCQTIRCHNKITARIGTQLKFGHPLVTFEKKKLMNCKFGGTRPAARHHFSFVIRNLKNALLFLLIVKYHAQRIH